MTPAQRDALYKIGVKITEPTGNGKNTDSMKAYEEWKRSVKEGGDLGDILGVLNDNTAEKINNIAKNSKHINEEDINLYVEKISSQAELVPNVEFSELNWKDRIKTPLGYIKMGGGQKAKFNARERTEQYGMAIATLERPMLVIAEQDKELNGNHERNYSCLFIKSFINNKEDKIINFESVTIKQGEEEVSISSHHIRTMQLITKLKNGRLLYGATALDESATSSAEQPTIDGSHSSDGKSTKNLETDKKYFKDTKDYADKYDEDYAKWDLEKPLECTIE